MNNLLIVDGNSIINRAYYGIRPLTNKEGLHTHAVYGFLNIFNKFIGSINPSHICVAFDRREPTFRHNMFDGYKATRKGMPDELAEQMQPLKTVLSALNVKILECSGYEADDIIGTIAKMCDANGYICNILSGDRDDLQLVSQNTKVHLVTTNNTDIYTPKEVEQRYGVTPKQLIEVKALMGDASDNIPGVAGIGEKTALQLIQNYHTLDEVYENLEKLKKGVCQKLIDGKDMAYLSRKLAEINTNVPIAVDLEQMAVTAPDVEKLRDIYTVLEFKTFLSKLSISETTPSVAERVAYENAAPTVEKGDNVCIIGNYIAHNNKLYHVTDSIEFLKNSDINVITHNAGELSLVCNLVFDTQIAAYIDDPARKSYDLFDLTGCAPLEGEQKEAQLPILCMQLYEKYRNQIEQNGQTELYYDVELPLVRVLAQMQKTGFAVDKTELMSISERLGEQLAQLEQRIYLLADQQFNINSTKQLGQILFEKLELPPSKKTKSGYSTDAAVLEKLAGSHEIIPNILEYRQVAKLKSTYADGLKNVIGDDGRIHSTLHQTVATTGRISSAEPNLQNIPIRTEAGRLLRKAFVAGDPDYVLISADYSQIELRVLAHMSNDEVMIDAFKHDMDIHTTTASQVFKVSVHQVTKELRSRAKAVNFGIIYGIGDYSLANDLKITKKEARSYIDGYLNTYKNVHKFMLKCVENAKNNGFVTTLMNRRRYIPEINSTNFNLRSFGERAAMNAPVQGSAADIIKLAMVRVSKCLAENCPKSRLIMQVHDELIVEAHREEAQQVAGILKEQMESAYPLAVPLTVDMGIGDTWFDI